MEIDDVTSYINKTLKDLSRLNSDIKNIKGSNMDGVEASRIIEATLAEISKRHNIEISQLREEHSPILVALQKEASEKMAAAETKGFERGKIDTEMRHWSISRLGFGRIARGDDTLDKAGVYSIIENTIRVGGKSPGTLSHNKILVVKSELESCTSIYAVVSILENNRNLICKSFGVEDSAFDECIEDIKLLDADWVEPKPPLLKLV